MSEYKKVFDEVIACIRGAKAVLILGPGEAKGEFVKHIKLKKIRGFTVEVETADKMTDPQLAAKVRAHFTPAPASKSVPPKKSTKALTRNRAKKVTK